MIKYRPPCFIFKDLAYSDDLFYNYFVRIEVDGYIYKEKSTFSEYRRPLDASFSSSFVVDDAIIGNGCTAERACNEGESLLEVTFEKSLNDDGSWTDCSNDNNLFTVNDDYYLDIEYRLDHLLDRGCEPFKPYKLLRCVPKCPSGIVYVLETLDNYVSHVVKLDGVEIFGSNNEDNSWTEWKLCGDKESHGYSSLRSMTSISIFAGVIAAFLITT